MTHSDDGVGATSPQSVAVRNDFSLACQEAENLEKVIRIENAERELTKTRALVLSSSKFIPESFGKTGTPERLANCMVCVREARRYGVSEMYVCRSLEDINGVLRYKTQFHIDKVNRCGLYEQMDFVFRGAQFEVGTSSESPGRACYAQCVRKRDGKLLVGSTVSLWMAKMVGWLERQDKDGRSLGKNVWWATMPDQMLMYRAAMMWIRVYEPGDGVSLTAEEARDVLSAALED